MIEDASIIRAPKHYEGTLAVRIDMADDSGTRLGQATARVVQVRPVGDDTPRAVRDDLYAFVRDLMTEMNVEVEYQVRRAMRDMLQTTVPGAAEPGPVEVQSLDKSADEAPGRSVAEPETMSPPERPLGTLPGAAVVPPSPCSRGADTAGAALSPCRGPARATGR